MNNQNYQKKLLNLIDNIKGKPKLLLHVCCGPCSTIPLRELHDHFDISLIFNNSNIYPKQEHDRRYEELLRFVSEVYPDIKIIFIDYDNESYNEFLSSYGDMSEGHERCRACFERRLNFGFKYACENGYDYFGTVMTISRYKNAQDINKIGYKLEAEYSPTKWLPADFKKNNGYEDSLLIIKERKMYFQEYCGCIYSYNRFLAKKEK